MKLTAPNTLIAGEPFAFSFESETRVAGRLRLTAGTDLVSFTLTREGREPAAGTTHRIRGRSGGGEISDWGDHPEGTELVLRFEGAKVWMTVTAHKGQ